MADATTLPKGFTWDAPAAALPPGFKEDAPGPEQQGGAFSNVLMPSGTDVLAGIADTLGRTRGPAKLPGARTPVDVLLHPEGFGENLTRAAVAAPLTYFGGMALAPALTAAGLPAAAAPFVGNVAATGAIGAGQAAAEGHNPVIGFLFDAAAAALTGTVLAAVNKGVPIPKLGKIIPGLEDVGEPARTFEWAKGLPAKALDFVKNRIQAVSGAPTGKLLLPAVSTRPVTAYQGVKALADAAERGDTLAYQQIRSELITEFNRKDITQTIVNQAGQFRPGPGMRAGELFGKNTAEKIVKPSQIAEWVERWRPGVVGAGGRSAAGGLSTLPIGETGYTFGGGAIGHYAGELLGHEEEDRSYFRGGAGN